MAKLYNKKAILFKEFRTARFWLCFGLAVSFLSVYNSPSINIAANPMWFLMLMCFDFMRPKENEFALNVAASRKDIIFGRFFSVFTYQFLCLAAAIPLSVVFANAGYYSLDSIANNLAYNGVRLAAYAVFNLGLVFHCKKAQPRNASQGLYLLVCVLAFAALLLGSAALVKFNINLFDNMGRQAIVFAAGLILYAASAVISYKLSQKYFSKVSY